MPKFILSKLADQDLEDHLAYIVHRDGLNRASALYDQIMEKIAQIAEAPFELGQRKEGYIPGLRKVVFKRLNIYFRYIENTLYVDRIISGYRNQNRQFDR